MFGMKKKLIIISGIAVVVSIIGTGIYFLQNKSDNNKNNKSSEITSQVKKGTDVGVCAKTDSYQSVEELEVHANLIVRGVKVKQNDPVITYYDEEPTSGYTLSDFCVKEILKDEEENIQVNDTISILENEFTDEKTNTTYHVAGYSMMDEENEYVLYLSANTFENGVVYYTPLAVNYGITSLGNDYKMEKYITKEGDTVSCNDEINTLRRKIRKQYKE